MLTTDNHSVAPQVDQLFEPIGYEDKAQLLFQKLCALHMIHNWSYAIGDILPLGL